MIFKNGRLIFPNGVRDGLDLAAENGMITAIRAQAPAMGEQIVDLQGNYLAPGFIDLHVHGARGRDTMEASAKAFRTICDYHAGGGTTSLLLTTATAPMNEITDVLNTVRDCRGSIRQLAGVHVEGPFVSKAKCGAQRAEFIQNPSRASVQRLLEHANLIKRITIAPELLGSLEAIENFHTHGISVS